MFENIEEVMVMLTMKAANLSMDEKDVVIYYVYDNFRETMNYVLNNGEFGEVGPHHIQAARNLIDNFLLNAYNIGLPEACAAFCKSLDVPSMPYVAFSMSGMHMELFKITTTENSNFAHLVADEIRQGSRRSAIYEDDPEDFVN